MPTIDSRQNNLLLLDSTRERLRCRSRPLLLWLSGMLLSDLPLLSNDSPEQNRWRCGSNDQEARPNCVHSRGGPDVIISYYSAHFIGCICIGMHKWRNECHKWDVVPTVIESLWCDNRPDDRDKP